MQFYVTGKIGNKRSMTPEGFLICHDVPLARTGEQLYRPWEVPSTIKPKPGTDYIRVQREPEEVFHPDAMASAEGKPVTIDHPPEMEVTPSTYRAYAHGHIQNVRRGTGAQSDLLLGDLVVKSAEGIQYASPGTEISMGYDCGYQELGEEADLPSGLARQYGILFNHGAMLEAGRCGPRCSIGDHHPEDHQMAVKTNDKRSVLDRLRAAFTSNDTKTFDQAFAELTAGGEDTPAGAVIINNHIPSALATTVDGAADAALAGAPDWFKAYAKANDAKVDVLAGALKKVLDAKSKDDDDDDDEEEKERKRKEKEEREKNGDRRTKDKGKDGDDDDDDKDKEKAKDEQLLGQLGIESPDGVEGTGHDRKVLTGDSGFLEDAFSAVVASAEILVPGIKVPTFDAKARPGVTFDQICGLRRKALDFAMREPSAAGDIETITNGRMIDTTKASCNDVRTVFNGAVALRRRSNNSTVDAGGDRRQAVADSGKAAIKSIADLNRYNASRFARKGAA